MPRLLKSGDQRVACAVHYGLERYCMYGTPATGARTIRYAIIQHTHTTYSYIHAVLQVLVLYTRRGISRNVALRM